MDYKELLKRLYDHSQSLAAYNDQSLAHALEDAISAIGALLAERNAVIDDLHNVADCTSCKFYNVDSSECDTCGAFLENWQWRGPQKSKEAHNA